MKKFKILAISVLVVIANIALGQTFTNNNFVVGANNNKMASSEDDYKIKMFLERATLSNKTFTRKELQKIAMEYNIDYDKLYKAYLDKELEKRRMTREDAERMANGYGLTFDEFVDKYLLVADGKPFDAKQFEVAIKKQQHKADKQTTKIVDTSTTKDKIITEKTTDVLEHFGYKIFKDKTLDFEPAQVGAIDPGYIIGPGDVLRFYMWGDAEYQGEFTVDNQGNIFIPNAGQVFVSGIQYSDLQKKLTNYLSKFFSGLKSDPPTTFIDVSIAKLKPIRIFIMGDVEKPGAYNISSFGTVFNALYAVGGPLTTGSLRDIRVIRNKKVVATVDLYDYLLKGQLVGDVRLQNNDIVFVPTKAKTIAIKGEVNRPAIYELKKEENMRKLIEFAGGLKATAYTNRVQVDRIIPFEQRTDAAINRKIQDVDLNPIITQKVADFQLFDGDTITIYPVLNKITNFVAIEGSVYRPGIYEYKKGMRLVDVIKKASGVLPETYFSKADIIRTKDDDTKEFISVNLANALDGVKEDNIELKPKDEIKIYSTYDLVDKKYVYIEGYVKNALKLPYADSLSLYDLVFRAGGLQDPLFRAKAYLQRGDIIRVNPDGITTSVIPFNLEELLNKKTVNIQLKPEDKIIIYKADVDKIIDKWVVISGEVKNPGTYKLDANMTISDLILRAGGFTEKAQRDKAVIARYKINGYPEPQLAEVFEINLPITLDRNGNLDTTNNKFKLQHKDHITIKYNSNYREPRYVKIYGEVKSPGVYALPYLNYKLSELITEAEGPTQEAFLFGAQYYRMGEKLSIDLEKLVKNKNEDYDIILKEGDSIYIPRRPGVVLVTGEVNNPGLLKFTEGDDVMDYIDRAGGLTDNANYAILYKANGESRRVNFGFLRANPRVPEGSIITVTKIPPPEPKEDVDLAAAIKDVLAILSSAVTIIVLAKSIK